MPPTTPLLAVLKSTPEEPAGYVDRPTVKAVVIGPDGRAFFFGGVLLGGGVEPGEDLPTALARECLEEAGIRVEILSPLGTVVQYRDVYKKRYVINGYVARFIEQVSTPTTTSASERSRSCAWETFKEAEKRLADEIATYEREGNPDPTSDRYQSSLFSTKTALAFLKAAQTHA